MAPPDGKEPARAALFPAPRSFFWLPIDGKRHAAEIRDRDVLSGELIGTLCGQQLKRAPGRRRRVVMANLPGVLGCHRGAGRAAV